MKFIFLLLALGTCIVAKDVCHREFSDFLDCTVTQMERRVDGLLEETSDEHQYDVKKCFEKLTKKSRTTSQPTSFRNDCKAPDFSLSPFEVNNLFLRGQWRETMRLLLKVLEKTPHSVQKCMLKHLKKIASDKVTECIREKDSSLDDFEMPDIPGFESFDVRQIVDVISFRMLMRHRLLKCVKCGSGNKDKANRVLSCVRSERKSFKRNLCYAREDCADEFDSSRCRSRYEKVQRAACKCGKDRNRDRSKFQSLLNDLMDKLRRCYVDNGEQYPEAEINEIKGQAMGLALKYLTEGLPKEVKYTISVAKSVFKELKQSWKGVFCGECKERSDSESRSLSKIVDEQCTGSGGNTDSGLDRLAKMVQKFLGGGG